MLSALSGGLYADVQTWRSTSGHSFEGTYQGTTNGMVQLKGKDGRVIQVPINALDEASKAQISSGGTEKAAGLTKGTALYHAQGKSYEYFVGQSAGREYLQIQLKDGANPIPTYGLANLRINLKKNIEGPDGKNRQRGLKLTDLAAENTKQKRADFRLTYENGAQVLLKTRSLSDGVGITCHIDEKVKVNDSMALELKVHYPALLEF